ncbi:MAG: histidine kinase [Phaeodactylibacter sp.]|nr:histidine kinase [Phaeodactylibacter sp.]
MLSNTKPEEAIRMVESILQEKKKGQSQRTEAEAYLLLGDIYEQIGQTALAQQRYQQALYALRREKGQALRPVLLYRLGSTELKQGLFADARTHFKECLENTNDEHLAARCREGLADLEIARGNIPEGTLLYDSLYAFFNQEQDSIGVARVDAKKAKLFVAQQDLPRARASYNNSLNYVQQKQLNYEDYAPIEQANRAIIQSSESEQEKIDLSLNTVKSQQNFGLPPEARIGEQLQLAELYFNKGELAEAEKYVKASRNLIKEDINPTASAEVYKKSSELNLKKGAFEAALEDYQQYITENEKVLQQKQEELDQQIAILKEQGRIDVLVKDLDIEEKEQALLQSQVRNQRLIIIFLCLLLLGAAVSLYFIAKNVRRRRQANQLLLLKSLRTQMNPHFIFNALNSVNNFISRSDERAANKFLADFARLMRMVLDHSQKDFISFEEEVGLLELYLKLEHFRFRDKFDYTFEKSPAIDYAAIEVPPMLLQPFVENAIWHGLRYKERKGRLVVSIQKEDGLARIQVSDDGIGRKRSLAIKTNQQSQYKSTGLQNVSRRIALINRAYHKQYAVSIEDQFPGAPDPGTVVTLKIPVKP